MKLGIVGNLEKKELPRVVQKLLQGVGRTDAEFLMVESLAKAVRRAGKSVEDARTKVVSEKKLLAGADVVIALGGDGTILRTARLVGPHHIPILGINLGKLGFLAEVSVEEIEECLAEVLENRCVVEERMMLEASARPLRTPFYALNDVVIDKYGTSRVMHIETSVNRQYLATYAADGIILSTPTGSTAYSLANGGPILAPNSKAVIINPICPHTLTARPVIVPDDSVLSIRIAHAARKIHLTADGQLEALFSPPVTFVVKRAPFNARLVKRPTASHFDVMRKKLNWGSDMRLEPPGSAESRRK